MARQILNSGFIVLSDNLRGALSMCLAMAAFTLNDNCMKVITAGLLLYQAITLRGLLTIAALLLVAHRMTARWLHLQMQGSPVPPPGASRA